MDRRKLIPARCHVWLRQARLQATAQSWSRSVGLYRTSQQNKDVPDSIDNCQQSCRRSGACSAGGANWHCAFGHASSKSIHSERNAAPPGRKYLKQAIRSSDRSDAAVRKTPPPGCGASIPITITYDIKKPFLSQGASIRSSGLNKTNISRRRSQGRDLRQRQLLRQSGIRTAFSTRPGANRITTSAPDCTKRPAAEYCEECRWYAHDVQYVSVFNRQASRYTNGPLGTQASL